MSSNYSQEQPTGGWSNLTPLAKGVIVLVITAVVGFAAWKLLGGKIRDFAGSERKTEQVNSEDFNNLKNAPGDPGRGTGSNGVTGTATIGKGRLGKPLVVAINTWAGHGPGIVYNRGLDPNPQSLFTRNMNGTQVKFVIIEDPSAKMTALINGDVDVMWDTVDNWAREASTLAERNRKAKSIIMQDWSRGGDGIVSLSSIKSVEDLKGHKIACTQFTPSHFFLLYLLSQSGLSNEDRAAVEKDIIFFQDAPAAAAAFKAKQVDAAVTWEPDLSAAVEARKGEAHVLVSTQAASNVIADTLVARQEIIDQAPETLLDFVNGWFEGINMIASDPANSNAIVGKALKLDDETVAGMLSGLKLTPFSDNAQFYGLTGTKAHFETLFDTAFVIWRKKGLVTKVVDSKDWVDARFVHALAQKYPAQQVEEKQVTRVSNERQTPILNQQIQINFTPGSDEIMAGSYLVLDKLGETMTSFGNTILRIEGNTDATGSQATNADLSKRRAESVKRYLVDNFKLPASRFQTEGYGSSKPIAPNTTEAGRQLNRRTDIRVLLAAE